MAVRGARLRGDGLGGAGEPVYELAWADEVLQQLVAAPLQRCHYQPCHLHANPYGHDFFDDVAGCSELQEPSPSCTALNHVPCRPPGGVTMLPSHTTVLCSEGLQARHAS